MSGDFKGACPLRRKGRPRPWARTRGKTFPRKKKDPKESTEALIFKAIPPLLRERSGEGICSFFAPITLDVIVITFFLTSVTLCDILDHIGGVPWQKKTNLIK